MAVFVDFPVEETDNAIDVFEFTQEFDLAFVAADSKLVLIFECDSF